MYYIRPVFVAVGKVFLEAEKSAACCKLTCCVISFSYLVAILMSKLNVVIQKLTSLLCNFDISKGEIGTPI